MNFKAWVRNLRFRVSPLGSVEYYNPLGGGPKYSEEDLGSSFYGTSSLLCMCLLKLLHYLLLLRVYLDSQLHIIIGNFPRNSYYFGLT